MKLIGWEKKDRDWLLTFETVPGWLGRLFGRKPKQKCYIGSGTVWHYFPSFKRVGLTGGEAWFADMIDRLEYQIKFENKPSEAKCPD